MYKQKEFNHALRMLVVPIALQNLISAVVSSADVVMLSMVNQSAMSAVSLAGQVTFILTLFYMGLSTGAGVLTAQYWGKKDIGAIQRILNIACKYSVYVSFFFFLVSLCFPDRLMHILTNDAELIMYGAGYLRAISFSYLAMSLSQMYLCTVKSMENTRFSASVSTLCLLINIALNALSIFIIYPDMPEKAIVGVAVATVCARLIELACCMGHSVARGYIRFRFPTKDHIERRLCKDYLHYTIPVQANYIVWGFALTAISALIGHISADMVAANSVASVVKNLAIVLCGGIASGGSILVGKYLGSGDQDAARKAGDSVVLYSLIFGVLAGVFILLIKPFVFMLFHMNDIAQGYLSGMLYVCAYYCIGKSINSTIIGGIFCAGGDTRYGFICDTVVMWGIILPLGYICAFILHIQPVMLYAILSLDECIKLPIAIIRYRKYRWLKNITHDFEKEEQS